MGKLAKSRHPQKPGINRTRQRSVALNLAKGMAPEQAVIEAGYSPTTARKKAYRIIRHPVVQSLLTECCERVLQKNNKCFDDLLEPFVNALDAKVVVKMPAAGRAVQTTVVDHPTRMAAAVFLIGLFRDKRGELQAEDSGLKGPPPLHYHINFIKTPIDKDSKPVVFPPSSSQQVPSEQGVVSSPQVTSVPGKRWPSYPR
ncbi:MAG: hypothetical protein AB7L09_12695 [Nitrospira sp.]